MSLSDVDRLLLDRCLERAPRAWHDFVDRFLGLVIHVANHTAQSRGRSLPPAERDDLVAEVFVKLVENDFAILRRFRRQSSLATYLAVIARRVIVRRLLVRSPAPSEALASDAVAPDGGEEMRLENREEVEQLLSRLDPHEARIVRMYHLEGKSYREISHSVGLPENSVGPTLSRARAKLRETSAE